MLPAPPSEEDLVLELDELWSFVGKKADKRWIWIALARHTRQVLAYVIGDRGERTCRRLWERIPESYKSGSCYSDFWEAYGAVIPEEHHEAVGKESGELAHVERWNNTLRQRLARFVRKTLSFSKSDEMHEACLKLFLHRYNADVILRCPPPDDLLPKVFGVGLHASMMPLRSTSPQHAVRVLRLPKPESLRSRLGCLRNTDRRRLLNSSSMLPESLFGK